MAVERTKLAAVTTKIHYLYTNALTFS